MANTTNDKRDFEVWFNDSNMPPAGAEVPALSKIEEEELASWMEREFSADSGGATKRKDISPFGRLAPA